MNRLCIKKEFWKPSDNIKIILTEIDYAIKCGTNNCDIEDYVNNLIEEKFISMEVGRKIMECYGIISEREFN